MKLRAWLTAAKVVFAKFAVDREYVGRKALDLDIWVPRKWLKRNLQSHLDRLPAPATIRITLVADVKSGGERMKSEVTFNEGTDETIEEGMAFRPTAPVQSERGSILINRVFGPGGGYERLAAAYGTENISDLVKLELRYPQE